MGQSRRKAFDALLVQILGSDQVYFQPPPSVKMKYPCIVYERDSASAKHADNQPYSVVRRYQVTYIDHLPDGDVVDKLEALPLSEFSRHFATSGLNHDVFSIYY